MPNEGGQPGDDGPGESGAGAQGEPDDYHTLYELRSETFSPPSNHRKVNGGEYVAPPGGFEEWWADNGVVSVVDQYYDPEDTASFSGPPELVEKNTGALQLIIPSKSGESFHTVSPSKWKCNRCGSVTEVKPLVRGGEITHPHECQGCERQGPFDLAGIPDHIDPDSVMEQLTANPVWEPPAGLEVADRGEVWDRVYEYIERYWDSGPEREWMYEGLTAHALSTWFRQEFDYLMHLLVIGTHESGKTRLLNTLKNVSYRCVHTASCTPAYIFRGIDTHNVTLFVSEYHDIREDTQQIMDAVLKAGQKRGEVVGRAVEGRGDSGGYTVENFHPFTHVAVSTQEEPRDDIVSRCFRIETKKAQRDVPGTLRRPEGLPSELLYLRFKYLNSEEMGAAKETAEREKDELGLDGRIGEKMHALLVVADLFDADITEFVRHATRKDRAEKTETDEAVFLYALGAELESWLVDNRMSYTDQWSEFSIKMSQLTRKMEKMDEGEWEPEQVGFVRKRLGFDKDRKASGIVLQDDSFKEKFKRACENNNLDPNILPESRGGPQGEAAGDGHPSPSQHRLVRDLMDTIQARATEDPPAKVSEVVDEMVRMGYDHEDVEHQLGKLEESGELYNPSDGEVLPT